MTIRNYPRWRPAANLDLMQPEIAPFDPPTLKTPTLEPNMKCIGSPVARYGHSRILGHMKPPFRGRGGRRGSSMAPFERAMVVFYRLSMVIVALSMTIRPQFAIECLRRSNQHQGGHIEPKFPGVPLGIAPGVWVCRERTSRLSNEIISEEFQPM